MPWYAQRKGLPDTHSLWADPGSQYEQVLQQIGYVEVPAPGQPEQLDEQDTGEPPVEPPAVTKPRSKAR